MVDRAIRCVGDGQDFDDDIDDDDNGGDSSRRRRRGAIRDKCVLTNVAKLMPSGEYDWRKMTTADKCSTICPFFARSQRTFVHVNTEAVAFIFNVIIIIIISFSHCTFTLFLLLCFYI